MIKYQGPFKDKIKNYLDYRENILHLKLHPVDLHLKQFAEYTLENNITKITKEVTENWLVLRENESRNNLRLRAYSIKCFAKYLNAVELDEAYVIDSKPYQCKTTFIPHIFSENGIKELIKQIDKIRLTTNKIQYKLFFKILYCTGMRDSELLNLKCDNINLNNATLLIKNSKFGIDRLIYINDDLKNDINEYINNYHDKKCDYLFYSIHHKKKSSQQMMIVFHKAINNSDKFNHNTRYRIHDLRHTFAVTNIKVNYNNNVDIYSFLPILMTYMGHSDIKSTEYYLRFTPDVYEKVTEQFEDTYNDIFPKIGCDINEK